MPDLFDEIKEDIQQEKYAKLWQDVGNYVIGGALAVVAATAIFVGFKSYSIKQYEKQGNALYRAFSSESANKSDEAISAYSSLAADDTYGYSAIANMRRASILTKEGKNDKSTGVYKDISESSIAPPEIRELAEILYLQSAVEDSNDPSILKRLEELAEGKGAFKYSAKELLAFSMFKSKEYSKAKKIFEELNNDSRTPTRMKTRSGEMVSVINAKGVKANG